MKNILIFIGAGGLVATAAAAQDTGDVRCLMVSNAFAQNAKEPQPRQVAASAMLFYGGRVTKLSPAQIEAALTAQQKTLTPANAGPTMSACIASMERSLQVFQSAASKARPSAPKRAQPKN